jgi:hypothetical protein
VTAYISLPAGLDVRKIDGATVILNGTVKAYLGKEGWASAGANDSNIADYNKDGALERMVKFDRAALQALLAAGDRVQVTFTGKVAGASFEGTDFIKVIKDTTTGNGNQKPK